jgi:hypothetical protein
MDNLSEGENEMSDCTFNEFKLIAREGVGNIASMFQTIADALPTHCHANLQARMLEVDGFDGNSDDMAEIIGMYASQLEDCGPFSGDTENSGHWYWRIHGGTYEETGAILIPDEEEWHVEEPHDQVLEIKKGVELKLTKSEADGLIEADLIYLCGHPDCDCYHIRTGLSNMEVNKALHDIRGY